MASRACQNRPFKFGAGDRREFIVSDGEVTIRGQNDANGNVLYLGLAKVGSAEGDEVWQISFHIFTSVHVFFFELFKFSFFYFFEFVHCF